MMVKHRVCVRECGISCFVCECVGGGDFHCTLLKPHELFSSAENSFCRGKLRKRGLGYPKALFPSTGTSYSVRFI